MCISQSKTCLKQSDTTVLNHDFDTQVDVQKIIQIEISLGQFLKI